MSRRDCSLALLVLGLALIGAAPAASAAPGESAWYVVRSDPRLCPSPLCGGYWVALANRTRTRCADGARRPRCYVARAVDATRRSTSVALRDGAIARAHLESRPFAGFGELGVLVSLEAFPPADRRSPSGRDAPTGRFFRVVDTGIRCVTAPCFSFRARRLNTPASTMLSGVDLRLAGLDPDRVTRAGRALEAPGGLLAQGHVERTADGGRVLAVERVFLRAPQPRA